MTTSPAAGRQLAFHALLEDWAEGMDYCAVAVPERVTAAVGTKGSVPVIVQVNDSAPFRASLFPVGGGQHYIRIKAKIRHQMQVRSGERIRVAITVLDRNVVAIPGDLANALQSHGAATAFASLPPGKQNFIIRQIDEAVRPATRQKRIQQAVLAAKDQHSGEHG